MALVLAALIVSMANSTAPSPLYSLFQVQLGFDATTLTLIYATYSAGVLLTLLTFGRISDALPDRRMLIVPSLLVVFAGALWIAAASSVFGLIGGRLLSGLGTGALTGSASAALIELAPLSARKQAALLATTAITAGCALGPAISAAALAMNLEPTHLPFVLTALAALGTAIGLVRTRWPAAVRQDRDPDSAVDAMLNETAADNTYVAPDSRRADLRAASETAGEAAIDTASDAAPVAAFDTGSQFGHSANASAVHASAATSLDDAAASHHVDERIDVIETIDSTAPEVPDAILRTGLGDAAMLDPSTTEADRPVPAAAGIPGMAIPATGFVAIFNRPFVITSSALALGWAAGAFAMTLAPALAEHLMGIHNRAVIALLLCVLQIATGISQVLSRHLPPRLALWGGTVVVAVALPVVALSAWLGMASVFSIATLAIGIGYGASFVGSAGIVNEIAPPNRRASVVSLFYVVGYAGCVFPILAFGAAADAFGMLPATALFAIATVAVAVAIMRKTRYLPAY